MLNVPRILILHDVLLAFLEDLGEERRNTWFVSEFRDGSEERLVVEDDRSRERKTTKSLPVNPQVTVGEIQGQIL